MIYVNITFRFFLSFLFNFLFSSRTSSFPLLIENAVFQRSPPTSYALLKYAETPYTRSMERMRSREGKKKSVDACGEGEAVNTRIFIYANGMRSRLIVQPHTRSDSRDGLPGRQSRDKGTRRYSGPLSTHEISGFGACPRHRAIARAYVARAIRIPYVQMA